MKRLTNKWGNDTTSRMVKMFGESIIELTNKYSTPSYRHRSLSTVAKGQELNRSIADVRLRRLPKPSLKPIIEEYVHSITLDPIVARLLETIDLPVDAISLSYQDSLEKMAAAIRIFRNTVAPAYTTTAEGLILDICSGPKIAKSLLRQVADLYVSHLVSGHVSRDMLHIISKREFSIADPTDALTSLNGFFSELSKKPERYDVLISASERVCSYLSTSIKPEIYLRRRDLPHWFRSACFGRNGSKENGPFIVITDLPAADAFQAAKNAKQMIELLHSFLFVFPDGTKWSPPENFYVYESKSGAIYKAPMIDFINEGEIIKSKKTHDELIQKLTEYAFGREDQLQRTSVIKLANALLAASAASRVIESDARLLSIWSAFEALLPHPMKDGEGTVRINHFADYITPLATTSYVGGLFRSLYRDIAKNYTKQFLSFLDKNGIGSTRFDRFLSLFYADPAIKSSFTSIFQDSELLLHRSHELHELANNSDKLKQRISDHRQRVSWQIHRIYRARNLIVHSAKSKAYHPQLTENAFLYFKEMTALLVKAGGKFKIPDSDAIFELCLALCKEKDRKIDFATSVGAEAALTAAIKEVV